jgi:hypothetical protein
MLWGPLLPSWFLPVVCHALLLPVVVLTSGIGFFTLE